MHDKQWLKNTMGLFLSHKKSGIEAEATADVQ